MSAVMQTSVRYGEPEGRGNELLLTWALYRRGGERDGLPRAVNGGWSEPLDKEHVNEPPYVVEIDRILGGLYRGGYESAVEIAKRYYLSAQSVWEVASKMHRTEGFVSLTLRGVCALVELRISE